MTNILRGKIAEKGFSITSAAIACGLKPATLHRRLSGSVESFRVEEVIKLKKGLNLTDCEIDEIFFNPPSHK